MSQPFRLGFLTHVAGSGDAQRLYAETLELFTAADELGFDVGWVAQHHFQPEQGRLPSLFPFLAAAASRTQRIRLGTSVVVLPLEHPLRVAEDAAVVDTLSGGRLELGVGSGGNADEFQAFGHNTAERHALTSDGLLRLQRALRGEELGASGQQLQPPAPTLNERVWQSALSAVGAQHVARHGVGLLLSRATLAGDEPTDQAQLPVAHAYLDTWDTPNIQPRIGLSRGVYLAADKRSALAELREPIGRFAREGARLGHVPAVSLEQACERLHILYGPPEEVAARLAADLILPFSSDLILQFNPATPPLKQAVWMLEQIAHEVAPALGWHAVAQPTAASYQLHPAVI